MSRKNRRPDGHGPDDDSGDGGEEGDRRAGGMGGRIGELREQSVRSRFLLGPVAAPVGPCSCLVRNEESVLAVMRLADDGAI